MADLYIGLETTARNLQDQLSSANRKVTTSRTSIDRISRERDSAVTQLSNVYLQLRSLMEENESLTRENLLLKAENAKLKRKSNAPVPQDSFRTGRSNLDNDVRNVRHDEGPTTTDLDFTQILDVDARPKDQHQPTETRVDQPTSRNTQTTVERPKKTRLVLEEYTESEISERSFTKGNTTRQPTQKTQTGVRIAKFPSGRVGAVGDFTVLTNIGVSRTSIS